MKTFFLSFLFISVITLASFCQEIKKPDSLGIKTDTSYNYIINRFFERYSQGDVDGAFKTIFSTNKWLNSKEKLEAIKNNLNSIVRQIDKYQGYEFITRKSVGSVVLCSYLVKYNRQPLRFTFILYKPSNNWMLYNFEYDDKFDEELKEAAKITRLY